jgi:hypothetical protein
MLSRLPQTWSLNVTINAADPHPALADVVVGRAETVQHAAIDGGFILRDTYLRAEIVKVRRLKCQIFYHPCWILIRVALRLLGAVSSERPPKRFLRFDAREVPK